MNQKLVLIFLILVFLGCQGHKSQDAKPQEVPKETVPRIISLSPSFTNILYAIGMEKQVIAISDLCPATTKNKNTQRLGIFYPPSEQESKIRRRQCLSLNPSVILAHSYAFSDECKAALGDKLICIDYPITTLQDFFHYTILVARSVDAFHKGLALNRKIKRLLYGNQLLAQKEKNVLVVVNHQPLQVLGQTALLSHLLKKYGGMNNVAPYQSFLVDLDEQAIERLGPNVILDLSENLESSLGDKPQTLPGKMDWVTPKPDVIKTIHDISASFTK